MDKASGVNPVAKALDEVSHTRSQYIDLSTTALGKPLSESDVAQFIEYANQGSFTTVTRLDLCGAVQEETHACRILSVIGHLPRLTQLDLSWTCLGVGSMDALCAAAEDKHLHQLEELYLRNNRIGAAGMAPLSRAAARMPQLKVLNLAFGNAIGSEGAQVFAASADIGHFVRLESLSLRDNALGAEGASSIVRVGRSMPALRGLNISDNRIGDVGVEALAREASNWAALKGLDLAGNQIGDDGVSHLLRALREWRLLSALGIARNHISDTGAIRIADSLDRFQSLRSLDMDLNPIGDATAEIFAAVAQRGVLRDFRLLRLSSSAMSRDAILELQTVLTGSHCPSLHLRVADANEAAKSDDRNWPLNLGSPLPFGIRQSLDIAAASMAQVELEEVTTTSVTERIDDPTQRLFRLAARVLPQLSDSDVREFETLLREAQKTRPRDTRQFRNTVNLLLDVFSLRIKTQDGHVGRLNVDRNQVLTLTRAAGGNRGFKNSVISLVAVERTRVGNRFASRGEGPSR